MSWGDKDTLIKLTVVWLNTSLIYQLKWRRSITFLNKEKGKALSSPLCFETLGYIYIYIYDTKLVAQLKKTAETLGSLQFALIPACLVMFNENEKQGSTFQRYDVMFTLAISLHQPKSIKFCTDR